MKALVTGGDGQLARAWAAAAPAGWTVTALSRQSLDIGDEGAVRAAVARLAPHLILNAAAFTAVDRAQSEPEEAWRVNRDGAAHLARAGAKIGARVAHISTDFVFNGRSGRPYRPEDPPSPLGVYGASKLAGEAAVLAAAPRALIVRAAWLYSRHGANFLTTMLRLMGQGAEVRVVADQIGTPTSTDSLAVSLWKLIEGQANGMFHVTDAGVASWYDFAQAIAEEALDAGLLGQAPRVIPIATAQRPTAAARPAFSVLDNTATWKWLGRAAPHWRASLRRVLAAMRD
ncbi:MAG: dTDP-4-dehydrorhamnose reductase [Pseudomonadota bacterium]|nr:dTDP-4-dehydrorhamnose reductase [Pseudomonadota bacterium]